GNGKITQMSVSTATPASCSADGLIAADDCDPCPGGGELLDYRVADMSSFETRCRRLASDGGTSEVSQRISAAGCSPQDPCAGALDCTRPGATALVGSSSGRSSAAVDSAGAVWLCSSRNNVTFNWGCRPLHPTTPPSRFFGEPDSTLLGLSVKSLGGPSARTVSRLVAGWGLVRDETLDTASGALHTCIGRQPTWVAATVQSGFNSVLGVVDITRPGPVEPYSNVALSSERAEWLNQTGQEELRSQGGTVVDRGEGRRELVLVSGQSIWSADLGGYSPDAGAPLALSVRAAPLPPLRIDSFAFETGESAQGDGGTPYLTSYALVGEHLFLFRAESQVFWRSHELALGADRPLAVWADGPRGRVGFRNWKVLSLPARVELAKARAGAPEARQFEEVCGRAFGFDGEQLFELAAPADSATVGEWKRVELDALTAGDRLSEIRTAGNQLLALTGGGRILRLGRGDCP
ncbi:MAG: hypothetical protein ACYC8T_11715, partial [Myxococcaceae bacterium]